MALRGAKEAADDLEHITEYLFENAPTRAAEIVREVYDAPSALLKFPYRGRPGKRGGTVLSPLPCIVIYQITGEIIHIVRMLHGAQKWP